ncbi:MAG: FG-GAP-like repeat-containing protein [Kofleriaceae bacterium]
MLAACSSEPEAPEGLAETSGEVQRGPEAMVYNLGWRVDQHVRLAKDLNQDGRGDLVGFGDGGVYVVESQAGGGYGPTTLVVSNMGRNHGWTNKDHVRTLADVNGDGLLDIVGIGPGAVGVALRQASGGYGGYTAWSTDFTTNAGWTSASARFFGDVTGDGKADVVGINDWGAYVAPAGSSWFFETKQLWVRGFAQGWDHSKHIRLLTDVNGDGLADLVGFGEDGVYVSKSNGVRFSDPKKVSSAFGYNTGWRVGHHVRAVANLNGDQYADLIGLGPNGVQVALGNPDGFGEPTVWLNDLGDDGGWYASMHDRLIGDVDGDGLDDLVGVSGYVFLARNNGKGNGFEPLVIVSEELTTPKGWEFTKHPRVLSDVDGDGRLELLGFFNDAVYWERLIPKPALPTDWTTPTCAASRLEEPASRVCEGPWRYTKARRVVSQHPSCQKVCSARSWCPKWENGVTTVTTTEAPGIVGTDKRSCTQTCNGSGCSTPSCTGTITQPTFDCQAAANSRVSALRTAAGNAVAAETTFDSAASQSQRSSQAKDAAAVTPTYWIRQFDYSELEGPGGTHKSWREEWVCNLSVKTPTAVNGPNEACDCSVHVDGTCEHDEGEPSTLFTGPGALRPSGLGISKQECLTYDDLPATTPEQVQTKFEKLWSAQDITPTTVTSDEFRRAIVSRIKLMYELWGEKLVNQRTETDQLHRAMSLYRTLPEINPSCAVVDAPVPPADCSATSVTTTRGDLIRCQRLLAPHASEGVASISSTGCTALLNGYLDLKAATADDATCGGPHLREVGAKTVLQLASKQLGVIKSAPSSLGGLPRQLWLLDDWYTVSKRAADLGVFPAPDQQRRDTSYLLGRFWDRVREKSGADDMLRELSESSTPEQAEQALGLSAVANRDSEQAVVSALFTVPGTIMPENVTLTRPPLRSLPLLVLLGDALKPFIDDLDGLAMYHDIACQFRDCRVPDVNTPSRNAWNILAALEKSSLGSAVSASPSALSGWKPVFGALALQQSVLIQAISDAVSRPGGLAGATGEGDVHPLARPLWLLHKHARAFHDHYEATGLFESAAPNQLHGSLLSQDQQIVVNTLRDRASAFERTVTEYRSGLIAAVQAQLAVMDTGAQIANLKNQRLRKATEMTHKAANVEGLRASGADAAKAFGSLSQSFADIQAALDQGAVVQVGDTKTFSLDGRSGKFTGSRVPSAVAAHTFSDPAGPLKAGDMLLVQTSGSWTPTCSISTKNWLYDENGHATPTDVSNAVTGPEGYTLSVSGSDVKASSSSSSRGTTLSAGVSFTLCAGTGIVGDVYGFSAQLCVHTGVTSSNTTSWSNSVGTESRNTAAFATGLRLGDTPFPEAPVGSLLVVLVDPATQKVRDVQVVHSGGTNILIEGDSTAYFVTNDKQCDTAATSNQLSVSYRRARSTTAVAEKGLFAMAQVLDLMRQKQEALAAQGTMLPNQATLIRQQAAQLLQARLGEIGATELPAPLASLFDAFVTHEIVATERRIEIGAVLRSLDLDLIEMRMIDDELTAGAARARLQHLLPRWLLRDLDHDHLRRNLVDLLSLSRDYLRPILELWYPTALEGVPEVNALLNADVGTSLVSLAGAGKTFVNALLDRYAGAKLGSKPDAPVLPVVVVSFPRPGFAPSNYSWRVADPARSRRVWDAIDNHTFAHFEITPDDFYAHNGGDGVLSCDEVVPLIRTMMFYVVRPTAGDDNDEQNKFKRTFQGYGGANQSYVTAEGPRLYQLAGPTPGAMSVWQSFNMPVRYGVSGAALTTFEATARQTRPVGLSATGSFNIDFSILDTLPDAGRLGADNPSPATEVFLLLEIDSAANGTRPTWVSRCRSTPPAASSDN